MKGQMIVVLLALVSAAAFVYYGAKCIWSERAKQEYLRFGIPHLRLLNGSLQLAGAAGLIVGLGFAPLGCAAASGLCIMMVLGLLTRYRLHDTYGLWVPASSLALLNFVIAIMFLLRSVD